MIFGALSHIKREAQKPVEAWIKERKERRYNAGKEGDHVTGVILVHYLSLAAEEKRENEHR
jgi:hypothetical protein